MRTSSVRSRIVTSNGVAKKIDEYVPTMMPTNCTSARSFSVPTPRIQTATTISDATGMIEIRLVLIERMNVWLIARLACSAKVRLVVCSKPLVFSSTLSNTITVS